MAKQLDISSSAGEPIIFVKSGKVLPESQVAQAVKRHAPLPTFAQKFNTGELCIFILPAGIFLFLGPLIFSPDSNAQYQLSPADLVTCSPGPAGLYAREIEPWGFHSMLPWIRFRRALFDGSVRIQIRRDAQTSMPLDHLLPNTFASQFPSTSGLEVCKFASNHGQTMPEMYTGEHIRRICAIAQAQASLTIHLLEILIFQLSNNFLDDNGDFNSKHIMHLMGAFGLDNSTAIRFLFEAAADQPTVLAVLDKFWRAAYMTSTKVASVIFNEFLRKYDGSDGFGLEVIWPLSYAIRTENLDLAKVILSGPQSTHVTKKLSIHGPGLLADCSEARDHEFALALATLLLERYESLLKIINDSPSNQGTHSHGYYGTITMLHALNSGNIRLARFLVGAGLDLLHHTGDGKFSRIRYNTRYNTKEGPFPEIGESIVHCQTIFTAAVVPHVSLDDPYRIEVGSKSARNRFASPAEAEKMALQNYLGLSEMLSEIGELPEWLKGASSSTQWPDLDVVVLAARYGYDALLQTFVHSQSSLNRVNGKGIWPLSAAALGDNASTCRLLVRLGADPKYVPPLGRWPTPLHHAVYHDSAHLVEVLLDLGADINHQSNAHYKTDVFLARYGEHRGRLSALALAICLRHWETACLLVHRGAEIDPLAFGFAVQSDNSILIGLVLSRKLHHCVLGRTINEKNGDSCFQIVSESSDAVDCDVQFGPQAQQITHNILSKAVSSGNLSPVSRLLEIETSGPDHHSLQTALTSSLEKGFEKISRELILAGARLSCYDLAMSFRSCTLTSIHEFITNSGGPSLWAVERGLQEFALEIAILDNTLDVVQFALEIFPEAYSSGALSAAVLRAAESGFHDSGEPMNELLLRRANVDPEQIVPVLENTALAIAILFQAPAEVVELLLQRPWPEMPALCCGKYWKMTLPNVADFYHKILVKVFLAQKNPKEVSYVKECYYFDEELCWDCKPRYDGVMPILPLTLAFNLRNDQVYARLMAESFAADRLTIEIAIERCTSLDVLEGVLRRCKEGRDIIRLWDDILHFALDHKNDQAMRHLIPHGANMSASRHVDVPLEATLTVLQRAVYECHSIDGRRFVQLLLDAGADVNEAPDYQRGFTALQAAALNGQLDLARQLVSLGADINAQRALYYGLTCLEAAACEGRLDMIHFLLDAGATTTGKGQLQYIRAVKLAGEVGHAAVAQILRKYRPWDESDESLFQEVGFDSWYTLHPIEYTTEEIRRLADEIWLRDPRTWDEIWPKIDPPAKDGTESANDVSGTHQLVNVNRLAHMPDDLVVTSKPHLAFDIMDDGSPSAYESETDPFTSQMVVSKPTSDYSMPLHTSFTQFQTDPDFHERIFEMED